MIGWFTGMFEENRTARKEIEDYRKRKEIGKIQEEALTRSYEEESEDDLDEGVSLDEDDEE